MWRHRFGKTVAFSKAQLTPQKRSPSRRLLAAMKAHRVWIEIVLVGTAVACGLALLLATIGAMTAAASPATGQTASAAADRQGSVENHEGMVTCSRCQARHPASAGRTATQCTLACVREGARFALIDGDKTYILDGDPVVLKKVAGQRARVAGPVRGDTIQVAAAGNG
jgi:hypothetical protein